MRVIIICNEFPPGTHGGIGSASFDLAGELHRNGIELEVVGLYGPEKVERDNLPLHSEQFGYPVTYLRSQACRHRLPIRLPLERFQLWRWLRRAYRRKPFDLVFCEDFDGCLPLGGPGSSKVVVRLNGSNFVYDDLLERAGSPLIHQSERLQLKKSDLWIGVSEFFLSETLARVSLPSKTNTTVIPNPVDTDLFSPSSHESSIPGRIVYHNTLHRRKGIYDFFNALRTVFKELPESHLEVYGRCPGMPKVTSSLLEILPEAHRERVTFHGRIDRYTELPKALSKARVACYPSHLETFGIAPVEAMAMKRVTIYSDCGPGREIIEDGVSGWLCPPRDPEKLAEILIRSLTMSPEARHSMGEAARDRAVSRFGKAAVAKRYLDAFIRTTGKCPPAP